MGWEVLTDQEQNPEHSPQQLFQALTGLLTCSLGTLVAGHTIKIQVDLYPIKKAGPRQLQVLVSSNEIKEIKGYKDIFVAAARAPISP